MEDMRKNNKMYCLIYRLRKSGGGKKFAPVRFFITTKRLKRCKSQLLNVCVMNLVSADNQVFKVSDLFVKF